VVVPVAAGMARLEYESNYINAFKQDSRVVRDYFRVESRLGGIGLVGVVVPVGQELDPAMLEKFRAMDGAIASIPGAGGEPAVNNILSLHKVIDPEDRMAGLPDDRRKWLLETKLDLVASSPQASLLRNFYNPEAGRARTLVRLREQQPSPAKERTFDAALAAGRDQFGPEAELTGLSKLLTETTRGVVETQWTTFGWAALGLLIALTLAFRDPVLAMLALLPTLLAVGLVLGLMGWLGLKLDIATALVASVALGLSVDDTFHCLLNFKRLRKQLPFREALFTAYQVSGPGVLLSSLAVAIGFAVLRLSVFVPFSTFGTMVCIATAGSTLGNLLLLPACLRLLRGRFPDPAS
jgi:predicted RND superfamily exporter protein